MKNAAEHRLGHDDGSLLAYGAESGDGYFRLALARFLTEHYHKPVDADDLFVTAGASQGLDLICTLFTKPGDTIFVEEPSYFLALNIFRDHGLNIIGLPMDEGGLMVETLEERLTQHNPAFLYIIPTFHNPSSITLSATRRERLVQLSQEHNLLIVADEVYHLLAYDTVPSRNRWPTTPIRGRSFQSGHFLKSLPLAYDWAGFRRIKLCSSGWSKVACSKAGAD